jgi:DNA-binding beta-propeller fold protein YncE
VISAEDDDILANFPLRGKPEFAVTDNEGTIYVNIENMGSITGFDAKTLEIKGLIPLGPAKEPTGLAIDLQNGLLFAGCSGTNELTVVRIDNGETVATLPIGMHCDGVSFMPSTHEIFTSNGEGSITAIRQVSPDKYEKEQTVITKRGARTLTCDDDSGRLFVPVAEYDYTKKEFKPDSFQLLVVSR